MVAVTRIAAREERHRRRLGAVALCVAFIVIPAFADDAVKIGDIDSLSGSGAAISEKGPPNPPEPLAAL